MRSGHEVFPQGRVNLARGDRKVVVSISVPGHSAPSAGFEVPLEMLSACHTRIERQCATLQRLVAHLARHGADDEARSAAAAVMRYFDTAARDHHADEEQDLFPALIESMAGSDAVCLRELTSSLAVEHRELEARWRRVRAVLERVVAGDEGARLDAAEVDALVGLYQRHIAREESELLPMAARLLSDDELQRIGRAMRERRGIHDF
jgi:hemerythrin-like domain-containing protein